MRAVHDHPGPVDLPSGVQFGQEQRAQVVPDADGLPVTQPPPTGHPGAVAELLWEVTPVDPGEQHEQDPVQACSVVQRLAPGPAVAALAYRQDLGDARPQLVWDLEGRHGAPRNSVTTSEYPIQNNTGLQINQPILL
jgi:hypothetical protein